MGYYSGYSTLLFEDGIKIMERANDFYQSVDVEQLKRRKKRTKKKMVYLLRQVIESKV